MVNNVDGFENVVITYDDMDLDETTLILEPAPYVADKVDENKERIWNEFLRLIGISNLSYHKKERNISDEIQAMQGGTIASRYSRYEPRQRAIKEINKKFAKYLDNEIVVKYYDGIPNMQKEVEEDVFELDNNTDDTEDTNIRD